MLLLDILSDKPFTFHVVDACVVKREILDKADMTHGSFCLAVLSRIIQKRVS